MTTQQHGLERTGGKNGLQTMWCGGGLGTATISERLNESVLERIRERRPNGPPFCVHTMAVV